MADWIKDPEKEVYRLKIKGEDVIVGDESASHFKPKVKLKKWGGECSLDVEFITDNLDAPIVEDGKLKQKKTDEIDIVLDVNGDSFLFDFILNKKWKEDFISMPISLNGLKAFRQPSLLAEETQIRLMYPEVVTVTETEALDVDGNVIVFRREKIIGSYAVYHATKKDHQIGQTNYMTGKAFHIYRPKAIDDDGVEHWIEMVIENGILTLNVSDDWFENDAKYPVHVDPDFGNTDVQETATDNIEQAVLAGRFSAPVDGTGISISVYLYLDGEHNHKCNIYDDGTGSSDTGPNLIANGSTEEIMVPAQTDWTAFAFDSPPTFVSGVFYRPCIWCQNDSGSSYVYYDSSVGDYYYREYEGFYGAWADPMSAFDVNADNIMSIYITYTPTGVAWIPRVMMVM